MSPKEGARSGGSFDDAARNCKKGITDLERGQRRQLMKRLSQEYPITVVCQVFAVSRSSLYYKAVQPKSNDEVKGQIAQLAAAHPTYGYRRITAMLHRVGQQVNNKRVRVLMAEMGLVGKCPKKRCRTTDSNHSLPRYSNRVEELEVERPDQLWVGDITYVKLGCEFIYLAVLMDVFTRSIRGWQLARSMEVELTLVALKRALARGRPEIHHSDQGVQYAAKEYTKLLYGGGLRLRVKDVDFAQHQILVRDGKGCKRRVTMLPTSVSEELHDHLIRVKRQHQQGLGRGFGSVSLPYALDRKYPNANRDWVWQFVFPSSQIAKDPRGIDVSTSSA